MSTDQTARGRADYYVLSEADQDARERFLCRLCEKILTLGLKIHIHTPSPSDAERLDARLWSFRPEAFIPHGLLGSTPPAPVEIGHSDQQASHREVFINLTLELPEEALGFQRIVEIVSQAPAVVAATRSNYRRCRERGLELFTHKVQSS